jgi:putative hemolysin
LTLANGVFSGAEIAVISVRRSKIAQLLEEGRSGSRALATLRDNPEQFLATVQIGITVVSASAAAVGGASLAGAIAPTIATLPVVSPYARQIAFGLVIALVSYLSLVLGELVPKSLALRSSEPYALFVSRPLLGLAWVARPLVWLLTRSSNLVLRPFGDRTTFTEARLSTEELEHLLDEAARQGSVDRHTREIAARALAFGELTAADVMVPRSRITAIPRDAHEDELKRLVLEEGHSRMPVYEGTLDNVVGYLMAKDLLALLWERQLMVLEDLIRPAYFVPMTAGAGQVLRDLQRGRTQLAIVVDEHGGVAGLLTLEDLLEELVGEILGEAESESPLVVREPAGSALVYGHAPVRDVNRELGLELPEGEGWTTVAGLCIALSGGIPEKGTRLQSSDGTRIEVLEATPRLVRLVRLTPQAPAG